MSENPEMAAAGGDEKKKERSTIQFPYGDLDSGIQVARAINNSYGHSCTSDQLAAALGIAATGGQFQARIATAVTFGLIERDRGKISLSTLGTQVVQPQYETQARVSAFLRVPLYKRIFEDFKGRLLPPDTGLENHMKSLGVAPKQADKARQAFRRSAEQAGLFGFGKDRLVLPPTASEDAKNLPPIEAPGSAAEERSPVLGAGGLGISSSKRLHTAIVGMLETLPDEGTALTPDELEEWATAFKSVLRVVYKVKGARSE